MSDWDGLMGNCTPGVRGIAVKTRRLVKKLLPGMQEIVRMGWKTVTYSPDGGMKNAVCSIGPQKSYVNLVFSKGAELKDPKGLLEGTGKSIRHVKIRGAGDVSSKDLEALVRQAARK